MLTRKTGRFLVPSLCSSYTVNLVGSYRDSDARTAHDNTSFDQTARHRLTHLLTKIGIIDRIRRIGTEIVVIDSQVIQSLLYFFFLGKTGMVRSDRNFHLENSPNFLKLILTE